MLFFETWGLMMHPPRAERKLTYLANNKATTCPFPPSNTRLRLETIAKPRTEIIEYYPAKVRITRMAILPLPLRLGCRRAPDSGRQMQPVSTTRHTRPAAFLVSLSLLVPEGGNFFETRSKCHQTLERTSSQGRCPRWRPIRGCASA